MNGDTEFKAPRSAEVAGVLTIAVSFLYGQTYVMSVLPQLGTAIVGDGEVWRYRGLSTLLLLGGLLGTMGAAIKFRLEVWQPNLSWSFRAGSLATVIALVTESWTGLLVAGFASGMAVGWLFTTLATGLRSAVGTRRLGLIVGAGMVLGTLGGAVSVWGGSLFGEPTKGTAVVIAMLMAAVSVTVPFLTPLEPSISRETAYAPRGLLLHWLGLGAVVALHAGQGVGVASSSEAVRLIWVIGVPLAVGVALDKGHRGIVLAGVLGLAAVSVLAPLGGLLIPTIAEVASLWAMVLGSYYATRSGRVWIVAGTLGVVLFLARYVGNMVAG